MITIKSLFVCFLILACGFCLNAQNVKIENSGFEENTKSKNIPDNWIPRFVEKYHFVETDPVNVYEGKQSALFNNDSGEVVACYYYGQSLVVTPGDVYIFTAWCKVAPDFTGVGVSITLAFWKEGKFLSRVDSAKHASKTWTKASVQATVPADADRMICSVEYIGQNKAWFDKAELSKVEK